MLTLWASTYSPILPRAPPYCKAGVDLRSQAAARALVRTWDARYPTQSFISCVVDQARKRVATAQRLKFLLSQVYKSGVDRVLSPHSKSVL